MVNLTLNELIENCRGGVDRGLTLVGKGRSFPRASNPVLKLPKKHPRTSMPSHLSNHISRYRLKASRSRSRSPYRPSRHHRSPLQPRSRSRSPHRHDDRDSTRHKRKRSPQRLASLPFRARPLSKHDYAAYKPMFALYLDIQKQLVLEDLDEHETRGRWKSFIGKWYGYYPNYKYTTNLLNGSS